MTRSGPRFTQKEWLESDNVRPLTEFKLSVPPVCRLHARPPKRPRHRIVCVAQNALNEWPRLTGAAHRTMGLCHGRGSVLQAAWLAYQRLVCIDLEWASGTATASQRPCGTHHYGAGRPGDELWRPGCLVVIPWHGILALVGYGKVALGFGGARRKCRRLYSRLDA